MNVFLDDIRTPDMSHKSDKGLGPYYSDKSKWIIARDYHEFVYIIDNYFDQIELISFDHDLGQIDGDVEFTGKMAADYVINYCFDNNKKFPSWYVHSDNTTGKANIIGAILSYLKNIEDVDVSNFRYFNNGFVNNKPT